MIRGQFHARAAAIPVALGLLLWAAGLAWADKPDTLSTISFDPASPVTEGTSVDMTGLVICNETHDPPAASFCDTDPKPVTVGNIQIQQAQDINDDPVNCNDPDLDDFATIGAGAPNGSGEFTLAVSTVGLGGSTIGFRSHYVSVGGGHAPAQSSSSCLDLVIDAAPGAEELISIVKTRTEGPLDRGGSLIDPVDGQSLTVASNDAGGIWIVLDEPQRYVFTIKVTNNTGDTLDDLTVTDVVPAEYNLDPVLQEDAADGMIDATCDDGTCDGEDTAGGGAIDACDDPSTGATEDICAGFKSNSTDCMVAASQPEGADAGPKGEVPLGQRFKEPELLTLMIDVLADEAMCTITVYVITDGNPGHVTTHDDTPQGDEQCHPTIASFFADPGTLVNCEENDADQILAFDLYEPTSCPQIKTVDHDDVEATDEIPINDTIALNEGVKAFLVEGPNGVPVYHGARQFGPSSSLQLTANGCDADEDGVQDLEDACPLDDGGGTVDADGCPV